MANTQNASSSHRTFEIRIIGTTTSDAFNFEHFQYISFQCDSDFIGVSMTFLRSSESDGTFVALEDDAGDPIAVTIAADQSRAITTPETAIAFATCSWMKIVSSASETDTVVTVEGNK